ncbi:uridine kinase [Cytobacillus depressus]|uniref:Uridine kinase n=1 Tax=Cytobacillus depressus TaxID=1602942 RepID=A0A6L3V4G2_9BACI|nr:AAA family ATPase [Cytobacillus depressus]KAB2336021.1 uridine kinase [Cytobacillus depressus]
MLSKTILKAVKEKNRIFVLGIDGLGGAGKTTFTQTLAESLRDEGANVIILHMDDFIHPRKTRYDDTKLEWECYYYLQWRYDYLITEILSPIQLGMPINKLIELYDKNIDEYSKHFLKVDHHSVLLLEGIFLQREEIRPFLDYVVFIDVPKKERLSRVLKRDIYIGDQRMIRAKYYKRYFPAEDKYLEEYAPAKNADLTIVC